MNYLATLFCIQLILLCNISSQAQTWAPEGAKWHYNETHAFAPDTGFIFYESVSDTVINNQPCQKIEKNHGLYYMLRDSQEEFMFSRNDTVFVYDAFLDDFQILYDFNAESNDTWYRLIPNYDEDNDTAYVHIDSVKTVEINGVPVKRLFASFSMIYHHDYINDITYNGIITECIGYEKYMFYSTPITFFTYDHNFSSGLRCYEDEFLGFYETGIAESCTYTSSGTSTDPLLSKELSLRIYPNPVSDRIWIDREVATPLNYAIISMKGIILKQGVLNENHIIDMKNISKGIYILTTYKKGVKLTQNKIIKL